MSKVHKENKAENDEQAGANERYIVSPKDEETIGYEPGNNQENEPREDLWSPPPILYSSPFVLGIIYTQKQCTENGVEEHERKADPVNS